MNAFSVVHKGNFIFPFLSFSSHNITQNPEQEVSLNHEIFILFTGRKESSWWPCGASNTCNLSVFVFLVTRLTTTFTIHSPTALILFCSHYSAHTQLSRVFRLLSCSLLGQSTKFIRIFIFLPTVSCFICMY